MTQSSLFDITPLPTGPQSREPVPAEGRADARHGDTSG